MCLRLDWKNFFLMKVISALSPIIPLKIFFPSYSKSSYFMVFEGSKPETGKNCFNYIYNDYFVIKINTGQF